MTGRSFSLILLLALVLFCGLFLFFGESATPSNSTVLEKKTTSKETPPITSSPPSFPVEELEPSERRRLDLSAPTSVFPIDCGWFGTVRQPDGKPAEGAKVILIYQNLSQATVTDSQGRYALSWVDADRIGQGSVFLQIAFQGLAVSPRDWPEPASPPIELNIQLRTASTLQVRVLHALERVPLEAFSVSAESAELDSHALTDSAGRAILHVLPEAEVGVLVNGATFRGGWAPHMNIYTDPVSLSKEWTFDVFPYEKTVDLQAVAAENGLPLQDVIFRTPLTAAPDGRLVCEVPVESRPFRTLVEAPGRSPRMVELGWTARNAVQIPLPRSYGIPFHLTDDGQVLKGPCELVLEWKPKGLRFIPDGDSFTSGAIQGLSPIRASLKVGPSGEGRLPLDSEGSWEGLHFRLMVRRPNTRVFDFGILNADLLGPLPWRFELQPPTAEVQVLVEDEAGYPVDGAQILLELDTAKAIEKARNLRAIEPLGQPPSVRRFGITDLKGLFRARMLAGAPLSCTASLGSRKAQADVEYPLEAGSQHLVRIVLPLPGLLLAGLILDPEGSPPSRFEELLVTATALETDYSRSTHPTVDGSFRFQELPAGVYQVSVADSVTDLAETIASAGDEAVELQMSATGIFELRLIDAVTGAPIERGAMAFYDEEGWDFINFKPGRVQHAMPAYWAVGIEVEGYAFSWLDLRPYYGMRRALETVALERGRTVSFSLTAMDGTPLSEVPELYLSVAGFRWFQALSTATSESGGTVLMWKTAPLEPCFVELKLKDGTTHMVKVPSGNQRIVPVRF